MGEIYVDQSEFKALHPAGPNPHAVGLWTFHIQEHDVCFYGRYREAASTAKLYACSHGLESGAITLVDCMSMLQSATKH